MKSRTCCVVAYMLAACALQGCYTYIAYQPPLMLAAIPPRPEPARAEMYYPENPLSEREYVQVAALEVVRPGAVNSQPLAEALHKKGKEAGVDAIIDIKKERCYRNRRTFEYFLSSLINPLESDPEEEFTLHTRLSGTGIIYTDSIDYLAQLKKTLTIYRIYPGASPGEIYEGSISYDAHGRVSRMDFASDTAKKWYDQFIHPYSLDHLVTEEENWRYFRDLPGPVSRRRLYRLDDWLLKTCIIRYQSLRVVSKVKIRYPEKRAEKISLFYENGNQLSKKRIHTSDKKRFEETLIYSPEGRLAETQWAYLAGETSQPFLRVRYAYYSDADLAELLAGEE
jgi:hypothetical protein